MNHLIMLVLFFALIPSKSFTQEKNSDNKPIEIQIIFQSGMTNLTTKHKKKLDKIKTEILKGKEVWIYPLSTYKTKKKKFLVNSSDRNIKSNSTWFDPNSKIQANEISNYLQTKNYTNIPLETKFSYHLKGPSARLKISIDNYNEQTKEVTKKSFSKTRIKNKNAIPLNKYYPEKKSQYFTINPQKDTLLIGEEGTKLFFAKGTMLTNDLVQIELKEYYKASDFIKADLQTVSNGKLLYTGGTIYLDARKKTDLNTQVKINPTRGINAEFTDGKNDPKMELFLKDKSSKETNWLKDKKRTWRYKRTYMKNVNEIYKSFVFNSPNEYQDFVTLGEAKKVEQEVFEILKEEANKKRKAKWEAERKIIEEREAEIKLNDKTIISRLTINELGFINADKLMDEITEEYKILADNSIKAYYYIIFEGGKGILKGYGKENINFGNVPVNKPATIIGISVSKKNKYLYTKKVNSIRDKIGQVALTKVTQNEIDLALNEINKK